MGPITATGPTVATGPTTATEGPTTNGLLLLTGPKTGFEGPTTATLEAPLGPTTKGLLSLVEGDLGPKIGPTVATGVTGARAGKVLYVPDILLVGPTTKGLLLETGPKTGPVVAATGLDGPMTNGLLVLLLEDAGPNIGPEAKLNWLIVNATAPNKNFFI